MAVEASKLGGELTPTEASVHIGFETIRRVEADGGFSVAGGFAIDGGCGLDSMRDSGADGGRGFEVGGGVDVREGLGKDGGRGWERAGGLEVDIGLDILRGLGVLGGIGADGGRGFEHSWEGWKAGVGSGLTVGADGCLGSDGLDFKVGGECSGRRSWFGGRSGGELRRSCDFRVKTDLNWKAPWASTLQGVGASIPYTLWSRRPQRPTVEGGATAYCHQ